MKRLLVAPLVTASLLVAADAAATSFVPRDDNAVVALDARTGERLWAHYPERLSQAECELHKDSLVVHARVDVDPQVEFSFVLDPATGEPLDEAPPQAPPLAVSSTFFGPEVVLANGWRLADPPAGGEKKLDFVDESGQVVWTIDTGVHADEVHAWQNTVFWAQAYLGDTGIVSATEAGATEPTWQFNPNILLSPPEPLTRPYVRVLGDELYIGVHEHVFRLDPATGDVEKKWDLSLLTGVPFEGGQPGQDAFYIGGLDIGTFSADASTLVVGFERHFVVLDRLTGDLLWHASADAFPNDPFPLIADGLLVLTGNEALAGPRPEKEEDPEPELQMIRSGCSVSTPEGGGDDWQVLVGLAAAVGAARRRWARRRPA